MKRNALFLSFIFASVHIQAQGIPSFEGNKSTASVLLPKVIPPTPTAASLGKYGDQQINMFTGTSAVNIPIYEIKTNGFSIPLSLAYSSSGLKVTEAASWVGLGWSVNGTGVITKIVKGLPDKNGGLIDYINIRSWPLPLTYTQVGDNAWNYIHPRIQLGTVDPEPDMYVVRAGKLNVKFYYDQYGRIQTLPYNNNIKIKYDSSIDQYIIIDEDGTQYFFGGNLSTEVVFSSDPAYAAYTSSWFLSKIITPVGAQILYNNVRGTSSIVEGQYSESEEVKMSPAFGDCANPQAGGRTTQWSLQNTIPVFLSSIETDQEIVYFNRDATERADMPGDFSLIGIKVYSKSSGRYEYNYSFVYSYFPQVSTVCWGHGGYPAHPHNTTAVCKRLRLDQFIETGVEGNTTNFKTYEFQYSTKVIPSRCSRDQDFWGYYNGANNTSMLPSVSDPDFQASTFNAVSREANHNYADAGMLQTISYPTGGETNFVYEPNEVNTVSPGQAFSTATASLSGISPAFESSVTFNLTFGQPYITVNFTLSDPNLPDQGLQRKVEIFDQAGIVRFSAMNSNSGDAGILTFSFPSGSFSAGTYTLKVSRNYSYSSYPALTPVGLIASVTYRQDASVSIINRKVGGFRIKKVLDKTDATGADINIKEFSYENPYFIANINNEDCISQYTRWFLVPENNRSYMCSFKSRTITSIQPIGSIQGSSIGYGKVTCSYGLNGSNGKSQFFYTTDNDQGGFSLQPFYRPITSYDHRRGHLLKQIDYNAAGDMVKITANDYEYVLKNAGLFSIPFYTRDEPQAHYTGGLPPSLMPAKIIGFTDFALPSEWVRVKNTTETRFQSSAYISTIKEFSYDNPNFSYITQTKITNSKGNVITEINKYPLDYKPATTYSNEEIERNFETDYQNLFSNFVSCDNAAAVGDATAINACYATYQAGYDNLINNRATALANYQSTFTTLANGTADPLLKAKYQLIAKNRVSELIENRIIKDVSTELSKVSNDFKDFSGNILLEKVNKSVSGNALENEITINAYDSYGNILQATPKDGIIKSFIWDYQNKFPIAEVSNGSTNNIAYTSFEAEGKGNWTFSGTPVSDATVPTGRKAYALSAGAITKPITSTVTYLISYWRPINLSALTIAGTQAGYPIAGRTVNGWKYYEHKITGQTTASINGSGLIDELRLCPSNALMSTSTYEPLKGLTSRCDPTNRIAYYDYDVFGRLVLVRDQDKNILKKICYNYQGQEEKCNSYGNAAISNYYNSQNCSGQTPVPYYVSVPQDMFVSTASQADADQQAQQYAQNQANLYGSCQAPDIPINYTNNTNSGYAIELYNSSTGQSYWFDVYSNSSGTLGYVPQGTYAVYISPYDNYTSHSYYAGCGHYSSGYYGASFYGVTLDYGCNTIEMY